MKQVPDLPIGITENLMKLWFPPNNPSVTIISAYALTLKSSDEDNEQFYLDHDDAIKSTPANDKLLLLDKFSARIDKANGN